MDRGRNLTIGKERKLTHLAYHFNMVLNNVNEIEMVPQGNIVKIEILKV